MTRGIVAMPGVDKSQLPLQGTPAGSRAKLKRQVPARSLRSKEEKQTVRVPSKRHRPKTRNAAEFSEVWCREVLMQVRRSLTGTHLKHKEILEQAARFNEHAELWVRKGRLKEVQEQLDDLVRSIRRTARKELVLFSEVLDALRKLASPEANVANENLWKEKK